MNNLPNDLTPVVLRGHVLDVLRELPENSVQCVMTSPPYWGLRAYGTEPQVWGGRADCVHEWGATVARRRRSEADATSEIESASVGGRNYDAQGGEGCPCGAWRGELGLEPTPELYIDHLATVFDEVRRVLREDGTCWVNLGDTYTTHPAGLTGPKRCKASSLANRDTTGAEQAGSFDKRVSGGLPEKNLVGIPWRFAFEAQRRGWWLRAECIFAKPNPMPESVRDRPTRSHEQVFLLAKSARYFYDAGAVRTPISDKTWPEIGTSYAGQSIKGDGYRRHRAQDPSDAKRSMIRSLERNAGANLRSVWWIATQPYPEAHFATFPSTLAETCLRAGTSERGACAECGKPWVRIVDLGEPDEGWKASCGADSDGEYRGEGTKGYENAGVQNPSDVKRRTLAGMRTRLTAGWRLGCDHIGSTVPCVVLDPFCGSGTVLEVARGLGLRSIGIELKPEYVKLARERCRADTPDLAKWTEEAKA